MKRLALASLALLISACGSTKPPQPTVLTDRTIEVGQAVSLNVSEPFAGKWTISELPAWLQVSTMSGEGPVNFTMTVNRRLGTPRNANQPELTGALRLVTSDKDGLQQESVVWTVTAKQFVLNGQLTEAPKVSGADLQAVPLSAASAGEEARGVVVTYRSRALRDAAVSSSLSSQSALGQASRRLLDALGAQASQRTPLGEQSLLLRQAAQPEAVRRALSSDSNVQSVTRNAVMHQLATTETPVVPTDQYAPFQWAYKLLGYGAVWRDMEKGGYTRPVVVAVADSGVRYDHPDLAGQMYLPSEGALDALTDASNGDGDGADTDPTDPLTPGRVRGSHGTHVTGIIAARWGQNAPICEGCSPTGVVGATYKAPVKVLPIRVIDANGATDVAQVVAAVRYAAGLPVTLDNKTYTNPHPAQIVNLSLGGAISAEDAQPMCEAIAEARSRGILTFVAAGNEGIATPYYPAACPQAVAVASVTLSGASAPAHAGYSNYYSQVLLSAPGGASELFPTYFTGGTFGGGPFPDDIVSTGWDYMKNQPNYTTMAGTSQATPQVSALAALLLSKGVTTGAEDTLQRLVSTSTDLGEAGRDPYFGSGMVNAAAALNAPVVSNVLGLRLQDAAGLSYQPKVDAIGRFTAYLGDGTYTVIGGRDLDDNGLYGERHEPNVQKTVTLSPEKPSADVGVLAVPQP